MKMRKFRNCNFLVGNLHFFILFFFYWTNKKISFNGTENSKIYNLGTSAYFPNPSFLLTRLTWNAPRPEQFNCNIQKTLNIECHLPVTVFLPTQELPEHLKELNAPQLPWAIFTSWATLTIMPWHLSDSVHKEGKNSLANCNSHKVLYSQKSRQSLYFVEVICTKIFLIVPKNILFQIKVMWN